MLLLNGGRGFDGDRCVWRGSEIGLQLGQSNVGCDKF